MAVITLTSAYICGWILPALITQKYHLLDFSYSKMA